MNLYGFANGDPVNLRDPFGLSADTVKFEGKAAGEMQQRWNGAKRALQVAADDGDALASRVLNEMNKAETSATTYTFVDDVGVGADAGFGRTQYTTMRVNVAGAKGQPQFGNASEIMLHEFGHARANVFFNHNYAPQAHANGLVFQNAFRRALGRDIRY